MIPGVLVIDTPGHEAFANLRKRGGSIADLAILVIDVNKGIEPQTSESIEILREYKTPFIVVVNKIDALSGWIKNPSESFSSSFKKQRQDVQEALDQKIYKIIGQLYEYKFNADRFDRVTDPSKQIVIVPMSAGTREGLPEVLLFLSGLAQKFLEDRLSIDEEKGKASILEVREEKGFGKTLDVILYEGTVKQNDSIAFATKSNAVVSKVKALLKPKPLDEIRDPTQKFNYVDEVHAASGVKIACENAEDALAGSSLKVVCDENVQEVLQSLKEEMQSILSHKEQNGVILKADALGSLEAISKLLSVEKVPLRAGEIGSPLKKDVLEALSVKEKDKTLGVIFAFNVPISQDVVELAEQKGVKLFNEKVIYNLLEGYQRWKEEQKAVEKKGAFSSLVLPAKIFVLPEHCFRASNPAVFGVEVQTGTIRKGYVMMNQAGTVIGRIKSIQKDKDSVESAKKPDRVAISMQEPFFGRQVNEKDVLYSDIPLNDVKTLDKKYLQALSEEEKDVLNKIKKTKGIATAAF
ncbi:MAG: translation initiation factor IF-2, partial [Candidatus Micrarchaeia archaeon]